MAKKKKDFYRSGSYDEMLVRSENTDTGKDFFADDDLEEAEAADYAQQEQGDSAGKSQDGRHQKRRQQRESKSSETRVSSRQKQVTEEVRLPSACCLRCLLLSVWVLSFI